ncbi:MAG: AAA family ATPase, partial [Planctomycetota bacterium]
MLNDVRRLLALPDRSFFLFGPRGVGKSTWLRQVLPGAPRLDLLDPVSHLALERDPGTLAGLAKGLAPGDWIVIDEIQKAPRWLDEVHRLMEEKPIRFALCGSSARKLRRGGADLLAGRAIMRHLGPFSSAELGEDFDFEHSLRFGMLPLVQKDRKNAVEILEAYLGTYIREEIREEGVLRKEPPFLRFLPVAGLLNAQMVNLQNIARETAVSRNCVENYFSILSDTLLGEFLPAYQPRLKVREATHPKFYWFDPGVARAAAGFLRESTDRAFLGNALETLVFHELRVRNEVARAMREGIGPRPIHYYRTAAGAEIDFVVETRKKTASSPAHVVCIEVKL